MYHIFLNTLPRVGITKNNIQIRTIGNFSNSEIILKKNENVIFIGMIPTKNSIKQVLTFKLKGEGAQLRCYLITLGKGGDNQNLKTIVEHSAKNTSAEMIIKSLQLDSSSLDYSGSIVIPPASDNTISFLRHDVLLLSKDAKIRTIPALEIETDDVKASHSVSIGKLDEEDMFYLESRGFDSNDAKKLLMKAFIEEILGKFPDNKMLEDLRNNLYSELYL